MGAVRRLPDAGAARLRRDVREVTELLRDRSSPRNPSKMCRPPRKMETLAWRLRRRGGLRTPSWSREASQEAEASWDVPASLAASARCETASFELILPRPAASERQGCSTSQGLKVLELPQNWPRPKVLELSRSSQGCSGCQHFLATPARGKTASAESSRTFFEHGPNLQDDAAELSRG